MGWAERVASIEQRAQQRKAREDGAFASLRELFKTAPFEVTAILAKIPDRKERCKVMLAIGMIDRIED